jgi:hypothetical protein
MNKTIQDYRLSDPFFNCSKLVQLPPIQRAEAAKPEGKKWKTSFIISSLLGPAWLVESV